jgi:hypothetical protein
LLLLLSEQFEDKAYPMKSPWYAGFGIVCKLLFLGGNNG